MEGAESRRVFLYGETPRTLTAKLEDLTAAQGEAVLKQYEGKWLQVTGFVIDVSRNAAWGPTLSLDLGLFLSIFCMFDKGDERPLSLGKGDQVVLQGSIMSLHGSGRCLPLEHCEMISVTTAAELAAQEVRERSEGLKQAAEGWTLEPSLKTVAKVAEAIREKSDREAPVKADNRKNVSTSEMETFCKFLLSGWPDITERAAHQKAVSFYPENKVPKHAFLAIFRSIRGDRKPGPQPKTGPLNH